MGQAHGHRSGAIHAEASRGATGATMSWLPMILLIIVLVGVALLLHPKIDA
jgi:hypothetical protein